MSSASAFELYMVFLQEGSMGGMDLKCFNLKQIASVMLRKK